MKFFLDFEAEIAELEARIHELRHVSNVKGTKMDEIINLNPNVGGNTRILTFDKVKDIIIDKLGVEEEKISADASFVDDLGADSLDTVELIMQLEEEFGIEIPDDDAEKITTVQAAIDYLDSNK